MERVCNRPVVEYWLLFLVDNPSVVSCRGFKFAFEQSFSEVHELTKKRRRIVAGEIRRQSFALLCM